MSTIASQPTTSPTIAERIAIGEFNDPPRQPNTPSKVWQDVRRDSKNRFKEALFAEYHVTGNPMVDKAYDLSEDYANGAGLQEVVNYFEDFVQFLRAIRPSDAPAENREQAAEKPGAYESAIQRLRTAPISVEIHTIYQVDENRYYTTDPHAHEQSVHKDTPCIRLDGDLFMLGDTIDDKQRVKAELRTQALKKIEGLLTPAEIDALRDR